MSATWVASGRLTAASKSLEYACWGPAPSSAPTLVLLHEGLGSIALWREFPQMLAETTGLGVFAYSRSGYGASDPADLPRPLDYMTREAVEVLPEVLGAIGVKQFVLVGHSDGATIAAIYAGCVPDVRLLGVTLMAPHFFTEPEGLAEIARAKDIFEQSDLKARMAKYHSDPEHTFRGWNDSWLHPDFTHWNVSDVIDKIRVPVLAIQGRQDEYGTLAQIEEIAMRCKAPVTKLILDDCRHSPFKDQRNLVLSGISNLCSQWVPTEQVEPTDSRHVADLPSEK